MFESDIVANSEKLTQEIEGKSVCVIGGAGSIGSCFIKAVLRFVPQLGRNRKYEEIFEW